MSLPKFILKHSLKHENGRVAFDICMNTCKCTFKIETNHNKPLFFLSTTVSFIYEIILSSSDKPMGEKIKKFKVGTRNQRPAIFALVYHIINQFTCSFFYNCFFYNHEYLDQFTLILINLMRV